MTFIKGQTPWNKGKKGLQHGSSTSFKKGLIPWNKGVKGYHASPETEFKKGMKRDWNIAPTIKKVCKCGKEFEVKTYLSRVQSCSRKCGQANHARGKNHWNWKGSSTIDYRERRRFRIVMQKQVFERDNYTCQMCGNKKDLQVDHIQSWAEYIELRFSINNCRTLCMNCHYFITFGRKKPKNVVWGHNFGRRVIP